MVEVCLERIATAVPPHDVHAAFSAFATGMLKEDRSRTLFERMAQRSGIEHRYSMLQVAGELTPESVDAYSLYRLGTFPGTAERMQLFERLAPMLLRSALDRLALTAEERGSIRHVLVTCCTGLYAPGLDFAAIEYLGLDPSTEHTMIGFMGCYAAINGLKMARHIVRSEPEAGVLLINLELCTLHFQETQDLGEVLSFLLFGDGCAASLIRAKDAARPVRSGFILDSFRAIQIPGTRDLITWRIGDLGFDMVLSGRVPGLLSHVLGHHADQLHGGQKDAIELWAVHPGGRSILDAVEEGLALDTEALDASRGVLASFGNMSSATIMFVLAEMQRTAQAGQRGCAMAFGPGLAAETMRFHVD